jgi:hypothetical protein
MALARVGLEGEALVLAVLVAEQELPGCAPPSAGGSNRPQRPLGSKLNRVLAE